MAFSRKGAAIKAATELAKARVLTPNEAEDFGIKVNRDGVRRSVFDLLAYPSVTTAEFGRLVPDALHFGEAILTQVETDAKYAVYVARQQSDIAAFLRDETIAIPAEFDFDAVAGLSNETRQRFASIRPESIGQAQRMEGITPAAITLLLATLRKRSPRRGAG